MKLRPWMTGAASAASIAVLSIIPASADTLKVHSGDTLWKIARSHHMSLQALEQANPNVAPLNMQIGTVLHLPSTSKHVQAAPKHAQAAHSHGKPSHTAYAAPHRTVKPAVSRASASQNDDVYWLAKLIHAEAVDESYSAQVAVGDVVLHRVAEPGWPKSVKGVIFQISDGHYQFTCVQNGFINTQPSAQNFQAARDVLYGHKDLVPGADVFYNPAHTPATSWVRKQPFISSIGSFVFARSK